MNINEANGFTRLREFWRAVVAAINALNRRIDNIITHSGTSSTEVVDARNAPGATYSTLKGRLDATDNRLNGTRFYHTHADLGITEGTETAEMIVAAMQDNSIAELMKVTGNSSAFYPAITGKMIARRKNTARTDFEFVHSPSTGNVKKWFAWYDSNFSTPFSGWIEQAKLSEVLSNIPTNLNNKNLNELVLTQMAYAYDTTTNKPGSVAGTVIHQNASADVNYATEFFIPINGTTAPSIRTKTAGVFGSWYHLITSRQIMSGTGAPEGSVTASVGTLYLRTDGTSASTVLYVKTSGTGNTGWTAK